MSEDILRIRVVNDADRRPVPFASLTVEYPDTIVRYETDRKGRLAFSPACFPITVTAGAPGMLDSTVGMISMPEGKVVVEVAPDPAALGFRPRRKPDWSSDRPPRFPSVFIVRSR